MKEIITFFGGDSQTGTTMVSESVAECLGTGSGKILYIRCGGKIEDYAEKERQLRSIDEIKVDVISGKVSAPDVNRIIEKGRVYDIIRGVKNPYGAEYFP